MLDVQDPDAGKTKTPGNRIKVEHADQLKTKSPRGTDEGRKIISRATIIPSLFRKTSSAIRTSHSARPTFHQ